MAMDTTGRIQLEAGPWEGQGLAATVAVCPDPLCDCRKVILACPLPESALETVEFQLDPFEAVLSAGPDGVRLPLVEALVAAFPPEAWTRLIDLYYAAKERAIQEADLASLRVKFPPELLADPTGFLNYREVIPTAMPLPMVADGLKGVIHDHYPLGPDPGDSRMTLQMEFRQGDPASPTLGMALATYDYAADRVLMSHGLPEARVQQAMDTLAAGFPGLGERLAARHARIRALLSHAKARHTPVRSVRTGRNDPCPCGSGQKYKRCCG